jgi:hypothetical protein
MCGEAGARVQGLPAPADQNGAPTKAPHRATSACCRRLLTIAILAGPCHELAQGGHMVVGKEGSRDPATTLCGSIPYFDDIAPQQVNGRLAAEDLRIEVRED